MTQNKKRKFNFTIFIYLFVFFTLLSIMLIASYKVLFRPWTARTFAAAATIGEKVYLFGGVDENKDSRDEIIMIDMEKLSLYRIGKLPKPMYSASTAVLDGAVYLAGGVSDKQYQDHIYRFDPESNELTLLGRLPGPRAFGSLSAGGDKLYYFGGFDGRQLQSGIIEIDPETGKSVIKADLSQPLEYHRSVTIGSVIYIIGGENDRRQYTSSVSAYSPEDNRLIEMKDLASPIARFAVAEINQEQGSDGLVIAGGWGNGPRNNFIQITLQDGSYTEKLLGTIEEPFADVDLVSYDNMLYLIGGADPRFERQIRVLMIDPQRMEYEDVQLKSYAWQ